MKPTLLFATLSMVLASPSLFAKTELETLRSRCAEQERQIRMLENENAKLRHGTEKPAPASKKEAPATPAPKHETAPAAAPAPSVPSAYIVKAGDSFGRIARKTGTTPEKLAKMNGLKVSAVIRPGQRLKVPGTAPALAKTESAKPAPAAKSSSATHTVRQGDTYTSISRQHGVSTATLIAANPKAKASALRPGQVINLGSKSSSSSAPVSAPASRSAPEQRTASHTPVQAPSRMKTPSAHETIPVSTAAPASHTAASTPAPASEPSHTPENKIRPVTIEGEMTYGEFASKHGTNAERLNALNGLDLTTATVLAKGSELYVPAAQP